MSETPREKLVRLIQGMPDNLRSDWQGTNHFELTDPSGGTGSYWWLCLHDIGDYLGARSLENRDKYILREDLEFGQRVGLLLDLAALLSQLKPELERFLREGSHADH